jgi:hypothetical protein
MYLIPIDIEFLIHARDSHDSEFHHVLDLRDGSIHIVAEFDTLGDDLEWEEVEASPEIFVIIPPRESRDAFGDMEDFLQTLEEGEARRALARALRFPKPFRSFKETLYDFPEELEKWQSFSDARKREDALTWLTDNVRDWRLETP